MIKSRFSCMLAAAALLTGFAACSDDATIDPVGGGLIDNGEPTTLNLALSQPKTYATALETATDYEAQLKTVDVFIYNSSNLLVDHKLLSESDFTQNGGASGPNKDVWNKNTPIATTTGLKKIYVGVNLPLEVRNTVKGPGNLSGVASVSNIDLSKLANSDGLAMFSLSEVQADLVADASDPANTVTVQVGRLVAKIAVVAGSSLTMDVVGGKLSDLEFAMRNSNKQIYPFQQKNASNSIIDPNWNTYDDSYFEQFNDYVAINAYDSPLDYKNLRAKYAPENTSEKYLEKETTYASIRANFVPASVKTSNGDGTFNDVDNTGSSAQTFYLLSTATGGAAYFLSKAVAEEYADENSLDKARILEYTDGVCYYNLFINPSQLFDIMRNTYYIATITDIIGLGSNDEEENDPDKPVTVSTNMNITLEIVDWVIEEDEYVLVQ